MVFARSQTICLISSNRKLTIICSYAKAKLSTGQSYLLLYNKIVGVLNLCFYFHYIDSFLIYVLNLFQTQTREMPPYAVESFRIEVNTGMWYDALEVCQICITYEQYLAPEVLKEIIEIMMVSWLN